MGRAGAVGGVHLLPIYPSSGDGGFAPLTYKVLELGPLCPASLQAVESGQCFCLRLPAATRTCSACLCMHCHALCSRDCSVFSHA